MKRAQALLASAFVVALVVAGVAADRLGRAEPAPAPPPALASETWICPHGGGDGWSASVVVMNPGTEPLDVRFETIGRSKRADRSSATVAPSRQLVQEVPVTDRGASTVVEVFGGRAGVAWIVSSDDPSGLGAEPCLRGGARRWFAGDPGTPQGDAARLVVANPFEADAIVDVALLSADRPPIRPTEWTDLAIPGGRSVALPVNEAAEGEEALLADVAAKVGRVAVASVVTGADGGIRSTVATAATSSGVQHFPVDGGEGPTTLLAGVPGSIRARVTAALVTTRRQPVLDEEQAGPSSRAYAVAAPPRGVADVEVDTETDTPVIAVLRATGRSTDDAATAGASDGATDWVVPSTYLGEPAFPSLVLVNPGERDVSVTLHHLPSEADAAADATAGAAVDETLTVDAGAVVAAPAEFLAEAPRAGVWVHADGGDVIALGATTSLGIEGFARYALVLGVPVPAEGSPVPAS